MTTAALADRTGHTSTIDRVSDLVSRLASLYPEKFRGDEGEARGEEYRRVLSKFSGHELNLAWSDVMDEWVKATPPPPPLFRKAASHHHIAPSDGRKRDAEWVRNRTNELVSSVAGSFDMTAWPEAKKWRARAHWDRLANMQAQYEDLGHTDPTQATADYYALPVETMWECR